MRKQRHVFVDDLDRDAANRGVHHRFLFPQRLRNSKTEAFAHAFLNDVSRSPQQRVDFERRPGRQLYHPLAGS